MLSCGFLLSSSLSGSHAVGNLASENESRIFCCCCCSQFQLIFEVFCQLISLEREQPLATNINCLTSVCFSNNIQKLRSFPSTCLFSTQTITVKTGILRNLVCLSENDCMVLVHVGWRRSKATFNHDQGRYVEETWKVRRSVVLVITQRTVKI